MRDRELCTQVAFGHQEFDDVKESLSEVNSLGHKMDWEAIEPHLDWQQVQGLVDAQSGEHIVPFRHPSQLYEGIGEGLILGLALFVVYLLTRNKPLRTGRYAAIFLLGYAIIRGALEMVRQWDPQFPPEGVLLGMTMGQTLSAAMVVGALLILFWPRSQKRQSPPGSAPSLPD